jgi:hypothetical protein
VFLAKALHFFPGRQRASNSRKKSDSLSLTERSTRSKLLRATQKKQISCREVERVSVCALSFSLSCSARGPVPFPSRSSRGFQDSHQERRMRLHEQFASSSFCLSANRGRKTFLYTNRSLSFQIDFTLRRLQIRGGCCEFTELRAPFIGFIENRTTIQHNGAGKIGNFIHLVRQ